MKKWMTVLMAFVLLMGCAASPASAYTVDEKFWGQAENQAVTGMVGFSVMGDTSSLDDALFQTMKQVLPDTEISFFFSMYSKQPRGGIWNVKGADGSEKTVEVLFDDEKAAVGGNALTQEGVFYLLENPASAQSNAYTPGIREILQLMEKADDGWKERAQEYLGRYQAILSVWMNDYAGATMGQEGDVLYSELACTIPAQALKEQIKAMLRTFYADDQALALLMEVLGGTGAEIYLNPAMESVFGDLVDGTELQGELQVVRRFDSHGALMLDSISLPLSQLELPFFPGVMWQQVYLEMTGSGDLSFSLEGTGEERVHFSLNHMPDGRANGRVSLDLPGEDGALQHTGYGYEWTWQAEEETFTLQTDLCERLMQGSLTLTPDDQTLAPAQQITLDARFTSQSRSRAPARLEASLVWQEVQGEATVALILTAQTSTPVDVNDINELENTVSFHELPAEEKAALVSSLLLLPLNQAVVLPE